MNDAILDLGERLARLENLLADVAVLVDNDQGVGSGRVGSGAGADGADGHGSDVAVSGATGSAQGAAVRGLGVRLRQIEDVLGELRDRASGPGAHRDADTGVGGAPAHGGDYAGSAVPDSWIGPDEDDLADDDASLRREPWDGLGPSQTARRWQQLHEWVQVLIVRNDIGAKELPDCWYLHGGLVEEMEALRWAWLDSYRPGARGSDPLVWREALGRARARWPLFNPNGCARQHSEPTPRQLPDASRWRAFVDEQVQSAGAGRRRALA